jgi:hypothetical protein
MEAFDVRVCEWAWAAHELLSRVVVNEQCPRDVQVETRHWQVWCEHFRAR